MSPTQIGDATHHLAERAEISATYVGLVERGDNVPTLSIIIQIAAALGVRPADLLRDFLARGTLVPGWAGETRSSLTACPANGSDAHLRGQGPRGYAARRTACLHVSRAMQAARRRADFDFPRRLGRRAEAGPRQVLRRVRPPDVFFVQAPLILMP